jgi:hypothetical protein
MIIKFYDIQILLNEHNKFHNKIFNALVENIKILELTHFKLI